MIGANASSASASASASVLPFPSLPFPSASPPSLSSFPSPVSSSSPFDSLLLHSLSFHHWLSGFLLQQWSSGSLSSLSSFGFPSPPLVPPLFDLSSCLCSFPLPSFPSSFPSVSLSSSSSIPVPSLVSSSFPVPPSFPFSQPPFLPSSSSFPAVSSAVSSPPVPVPAPVTLPIPAPVTIPISPSSVVVVPGGGGAGGLGHPSVLGPSPCSRGPVKRVVFLDRKSFDLVFGW